MTPVSPDSGSSGAGSSGAGSSGAGSSGAGSSGAGAPAVPPVDLHPEGFAALPPDVRAQLDLVLAPVEEAMTELDQLRADNAAALERERARGLDPDLERALAQAARNPDAPQSLHRIARQVARGELSWGDVFGPGARTDDPDVAAVRRDTFETARAQFDRDDWKVEVVPIDPDGPPPPRRGTWVE